MRLPDGGDPYLGTLEPVVAFEDDEEEEEHRFAPDEPDWRGIGAEAPEPLALPGAVKGRKKK